MSFSLLILIMKICLAKVTLKPSGQKKRLFWKTPESFPVLRPCRPGGFARLGACQAQGCSPWDRRPELTLPSEPTVNLRGPHAPVGVTGTPQKPGKLASSHHSPQHTDIFRFPRNLQLTRKQWIFPIFHKSYILDCDVCEAKNIQMITL